MKKRKTLKAKQQARPTQIPPSKAATPEAVRWNASPKLDERSRDFSRAVVAIEVLAPWEQKEKREHVRQALHILRFVRSVIADEIDTARGGDDQISREHRKRVHQNAEHAKSRIGAMWRAMRREGENTTQSTIRDVAERLDQVLKITNFHGDPEVSLDERAKYLASVLRETDHAVLVEAVKKAQRGHRATAVLQILSAWNIRATLDNVKKALARSRGHA
jgi:hypothetical protein